MGLSKGLHHQKQACQGNTEGPITIRCKKNAQLSETICRHSPIWEEKQVSILRRGLLAKFDQNPKLKKFLVATGDRIIGEASTECTWGIGMWPGMWLEHDDVLDHRKWTGENLLGEELPP